MTHNPIGLHIQAQGKGFDRNATLAHVKKAQYLTCTVLDDLQLAIDLDIPYAVFRAWAFEPNPGDNPKNAAKQAIAQIATWAATHHGGHNVLYNVNCEKTWSKSRNEMYSEMIELSADAAANGIPFVGLCVGNYGSGTVKSGQGDDPNWWASPDGELLLRTLAKHRDVKMPNGSYAFVLGVHEYTGIHPWIASNGAEKRLNPQWEHRPRSIDWNKAQWHLGRAAQGIIEACEKYGIKPPRMLITECLIDDMDDVAYTFGNRDQNSTGLDTIYGYGKKARGWRSLVPQWKKWYPGKDVENGGLYADMLKWTWETIYKPLGFVIGMHTYTWASTGDWESFRVDNAPGYISAMESYVQTTPPPQPEPPTPQPTEPTVPKKDYDALKALYDAIVAERAGLLARVENQVVVIQGQAQTISKQRGEINHFKTKIRTIYSDTQELYSLSQQETI